MPENVVCVDVAPVDASATVSVDGVVTEAICTPISSESATIHVEAPGYVPQDLTVRVDPMSQSPLLVQLVLDSGLLP